MATASFTYSLDSTDYPFGDSSTSTLEDVLYNWSADGIPGTHPSNTGGFYTGGVASGFSGDTYAFTTGSGYAFSVTGELSYYFPPISGSTVPGATPHTLYGTLESISFGGGLNADGSVDSPFLTISFDDPITSALLEGHAGDVHTLINDLMGASVDQLLSVLETDYGVDIGDTLADLGSASLVGVSAADDYLLAA